MEKKKCEVPNSVVQSHNINLQTSLPGREIEIVASRRDPPASQSESTTPADDRRLTRRREKRAAAQHRQRAAVVLLVRENEREGIVRRDPLQRRGGGDPLRVAYVVGGLRRTGGERIVPRVQ